MPEWLVRFSIHVDAGYLYGALATRETGSSNRDAITVDEAVLIRDLVQAADDSGATLLRVLWYDAGRNGLDLRSMSITRAVEVAYVISGDDDLTEAVTDAQDQGCRSS